MLNVFEQEPYFTNEQGISFWIDTEITKHLKYSKLHGYQAWITRDLNDYKERILVCSGRVVYATQQWDDMLFHIDMLNLAENFK